MDAKENKNELESNVDHMLYPAPTDGTTIDFEK